MRPRIKHVQLAGSSNFQTIIEHKEDLRRNHEENKATFMAINQTIQLPKKSSLELFEEWVKNATKEYKLLNRNKK